MESIRKTGKPAIKTWMVLGIAGASSFAAAVAYLAYMANGIAAGAIIGLPGRGGDVTVAQQHAAGWLVMFSAFQFGVVIAIFSLLQFGADADRLPRFVSRGVVAMLLAFISTPVVGIILFEVLNLLRPHCIEWRKIAISPTIILLGDSW